MLGRCFDRKEKERRKKQEKRKRRREKKERKEKDSSGLRPLLRCVDNSRFALVTKRFLPLTSEAVRLSVVHER